MPKNVRVGGCRGPVLAFRGCGSVRREGGLGS